MCRMQCVRASIHSLGVRERSLTIRIQWNGHERWSPCDSLEEDPPSTRQFGMKKDKKDFQKQYRIPIHTLPFMEDPLHLKEAERLFLKTLV